MAYRRSASVGGQNLDALAVFAAIAEAGGFTAAAARLGVSQSTLSHAMKTLERRLGRPLLARTTRSVAPTPAGEELLRALRPALEDIDAALERLGAGVGVAAGPVRLTMTRDVAENLVWPALPEFLMLHPRIDVEIDASDAFTDIVAGRFDAGVRLRERIERDMIASRIGVTRAAVVGSPSYLERSGRPGHPDELGAHACIAYRLPTSSAVHAWPFEQDGHRLEVRTSGRLVLNDGRLIVLAALAGQGLAYVYRHMVADELAAGTLVETLADWMPVEQDVSVYYPDRRVSPAFAALLSFLRERREASGERTSSPSDPTSAHSSPNASPVR